MSQYNAVDGQSIFDVCLQTYGSMDFLYKLVGDNAFPDINTNPFSNQAFSFDPDLLVDQVLGGAAVKGNKLATLYSPSPIDKSSTQSLTLITKVYATAVPSISIPNISINMAYQKSDSDSYTAGADGQTVISMADWIGWDVLQVEHEIKPLKKTDWAWNKTSGQLSLLGGITLDNNQTLYFLFKKMTT
jgi:hypothetical protein